MARYGVKFADDSIQSYFNEKSWYEPKIESSAYNPSILSDIELENYQFLQGYLMDEIHGDAESYYSYDNEDNEDDSHNSGNNTKKPHYIKCGICGGIGTCSQCSGSGNCKSCFGKGAKLCSCRGGKCSTCGGHGKIPYMIAPYRERTCQSCHGSGICPSCSGTKYYPCTMCNKTGKCTSCHGSGDCKYCNGAGEKLIIN